MQGITAWKDGMVDKNVDAVGWKYSVAIPENHVATRKKGIVRRKNDIATQKNDIATQKHGLLYTNWQW